MPALGPGGALEPIAVVERAVAEERADLPSVDVLLSGFEISLDLRLAVLHARRDLRLRCSGESSLKGSAFPASTPRRASFARMSVSSGRGRRELQREGEVVEEPGLNHLRVDLRKVDRRRRGRGGCFRYAESGWTL